MKKIKCAILGYGDRAFCYSKYAFTNPEELEIVAVIDPNPVKLEMAKERFGLSEDMLFENLDAFLEKEISCEAVINATMDNLHYETTIKLLKSKYNVLLEKPITGNPQELFEIHDLAQQNNLKVVVCHVLRYTLFYRKIKELLDAGEIGKIINMQLNEHVGCNHFVKAYVRGKWRNEKNCGSGFLLAKCCHDTDLMCWLNNMTTPTEVSSFGQRAIFCPENAPENSTEYCYNCPISKDCMYNAYTFELINDPIPQYTWAGINKPLDQITEEEKREFLKHDVFGKCVYKTDMDIVDRQCVSVNFANGSVATLNMVGGTSKPGRHIHIICEFGEIIGDIEEHLIIYRKYNKSAMEKKWAGEKSCYIETIVSPEEGCMEENTATTGHYGGDYFIMRDFVRVLNGEKTSVSTTLIKDSVNSHLICYAAEKSRKEKVVVSLQDYKA